MTSPTLTPPIVGQAESAHLAVLQRVLARTGNTRDEWVALTITTNSGDSIARDALVAKMIGAVNLLLDVTDRKQANLLREQAERCRRLACSVGGDPAADALNRMAREYDDRALRLDP